MNMFGTSTDGTSNTYALHVDRSSSQYAYHSDNSAFDVAGNLTIEAWVKLDNAPPTNEQYTIVSKLHGGSASNRSYQLSYLDVSGTKKIRFSIADASSNTNHEDFTYTLTPGAWYHIAAVYTATSSNFQIFVNGSSIGSLTGTITAIGNSTVDFAIGMLYDNPGNTPLYFFNGAIDDVRIWNTARSSANIAAYKDKELVGNESGLVAYYKFNNSYTDVTSSGNTLTAVNVPTFTTSSAFTAATSSNATYVYAGTGYANPHAPTSIASTTLTYDNNGNATNYGVWNYSWDYRNRMTQAATGTATSTYAYDYQNQRVKQVDGSVTTIYPHRYWNIAGATSTSYIYAGDMLLATIEADGRATTTRYVHPDHLGSTNVVTNASGTPTQVLDYLPYGGIRYSSSTGQTNEKHQFIGQYTDSSGLNYLNARYLQNSRGQFLSQDPVFWSKQDLLNPQSQNSYSYGNGSPIVNEDPSGKCSGSLFLVCVGGAMGAAYGMAWQVTYDNSAGTVSSVSQYMKSELKGGLAGASVGASLSYIGPVGTLDLYGYYETYNNLTSVYEQFVKNPGGYTSSQQNTTLGLTALDSYSRIIGPFTPMPARAGYDATYSILGGLIQLLQRLQSTSKSTAPTNTNPAQSSRASTNWMSGPIQTPLPSSSGYGSAGSVYTNYIAPNTHTACGNLCK